MTFFGGNTASHRNQAKSNAGASGSAGKWLLSATISALVFTSIVAISGIFFFANDDVGIQNILSGVSSSSPEPHAVFINYVSSWIIASLFSFFPSIPWWSIYQLLTLLFSGTVVLYCCLTIFSHLFHKLHHGRNAFLLIVVSSTVLFSLFYFPVARPQFTLTASYAGATAILWLFTMRKFEKPRLRVVVVSVTLLALGFCTRSICAEIAFAFLCLCVVVVAAQELSKSGFREWRGLARKAFGSSLFATILSAGVVMLALSAIHSAAYSSAEWTEFESVNDSRSSFMDYSHDDFSENPQPYLDEGWDETLARLVNNWFFMDQRVDGDSFRSIFDATKHNWSVGESMFVDLFEKTGVFSNRSAVAYLGMSATSLCLLLLSRRDKWSVLSVVAIIVSALALLLYLDYRGRLIVRAMQSVVIPAMFAAIALSVSLRDSETMVLESVSDRSNVSPRFAFALISCVASVGLLIVHVMYDRGLSYALVASPFLVLLIGLIFVRRKGKHSRISYGPVCIALLLLLVVQGLSLVPLYSRWSDNYKSYESSQNRYMEFNDYADANEDLVFVVPAGVFAHNSIFLKPYADNRIPWGGWEYYTQWSSKKRVSKGFEEPPAPTDFISDKVRFVFQNQATADLFANYLESQLHQNIVPSLEDTLPCGVCIYSFEEGESGGEIE